jgi:hypothetical protein
MNKRKISEEDVRWILEKGKAIRSYPNDRPYPSRLVLGYIGNRPIHVVAADDPSNDLTIVVTVYEPNPRIWDFNFERKTKP